MEYRRRESKSLMWLRWIAVLFVLASVCSVFVVVGHLWRWGYGWRETKDWAISTVAGQRTEFSSGFTEGLFEEIQIGMTHQDVNDVLGPPLFRGFSSDPDKYWMYSQPAPGSANFHRRDIWFSPGGRVTGVVRAFYWD